MYIYISSSRICFLQSNSRCSVFRSWQLSAVGATDEMKALVKVKIILVCDLTSPLIRFFGIDYVDLGHQTFRPDVEGVYPWGGGNHAWSFHQWNMTGNTERSQTCNESMLYLPRFVVD